VRPRFPFVKLPAALVLARVMTAVFFLAHAIVRIGNGSIPQFARALEAQGFPAGLVLVWAITTVEIAAGIGLLLGRHVRVAAAGLLVIAVGGIAIIHRHFGWFVGEHGTGGSEYSVALIVLLVVVAAADGDRRG
jgi:putative oxidoreductase